MNIAATKAVGECPVKIGVFRAEADADFAGVLPLACAWEIVRRIRHSRRRMLINIHSKYVCPRRHTCELVLSALIGAGLPADWLAEHQQALAAVTVDQVQEASRRYLGAAALTAVVVGDAERVADPLRALAPVTVAGEITA